MMWGVFMNASSSTALQNLKLWNPTDYILIYIDIDIDILFAFRWSSSKYNSRI
jgi:hypothetical protein